MAGPFWIVEIEPFNSMCSLSIQQWIPASSEEGDPLKWEVKNPNPHALVPFSVPAPQHLPSKRSIEESVVLNCGGAPCGAPRVGGASLLEPARVPTKEKAQQQRHTFGNSVGETMGCELE